MNIPRVRQLMDDRTYAVRGSDDVFGAVESLIKHGVTGVPVVDDEERLIGLLTERECLTLLTHQEQDYSRVDEIMSTHFHTVSPDMDVAYVAGLFNGHPEFRRFMVVEDDRLVGVITRKDILRAINQVAGKR